MATEHQQRVEEARLGVVFAYEQKHYQRWLSRQRVAPSAVRGSDGRGLAGADLERAVMALALSNPDIVQVRVH